MENHKISRRKHRQNLGDLGFGNSFRYNMKRMNHERKIICTLKLASLVAWTVKNLPLMQETLV